MAVVTRRKPARRTPTQAAADRNAVDLARKLGLMLRDGRTRLRLKQSEAADRAGISRGRWADLEAGRSSGATLRTISRSAAAALWSVTDWIDDVGAIVRDFVRRVDAVERYAIARMLPDEQLPRTGGCWVVRATQRNRRLTASIATSSAPASPAPAARGSPRSPPRPRQYPQSRR